MKIRRLRLANYRGIEAVELHFAAEGVTVVQGPNEAGKSSLAEALDILFEEKDRTTRKGVLAVKPVHRDEGAEIEAEIETGPYRFSYFKRYHRRTETRLEVTAPRKESLTGDPAHDRVRAILDETVDLALWKALRLVQGERLELPDLAHGRALTQALDRAAGGAAAGAREEGLYEAILAEYRRYWTDNGRERKELTEARAELERLTAEMAAIEAELGRLDADLDRVARLDREIADAKRQDPALEREASVRAAELAQLEKAEALARAARAEAEALRAAATAAVQAVGERRALTGRIEAEEKSLALRAQGLAAASPARAAAEEEYRRAQTVLAEARNTLAAREESARELAREASFHAARSSLKLYEIRRDRHVVARAARIEAEKLLGAEPVDDARLAALAEAHDEVERARARLESSSATIRVEAEAAVDIEIGGERRGLEPGEAHEAVVKDELHLALPGLVRITVRSGADSGSLAGALERAERHFATLALPLGIGSLAEARRANLAWRDARHALERFEASRKQDLIDLGFEELEARIGRDRAQVEAFLADPPASADLEADPLAAKERAESAGRAAEEARESLESARNRVEGLRKRHDELDAQANVEERMLSADRLRLEEEQAALARRRAESDDEALARRAAEAEDRCAAAQAAAGTASRELAAELAERTRERAVNARATLEAARARRRHLEDERLQSAERLTLLGERGLAEELGRRQAALASARDRKQSLDARAAAARLLLETFDEERTKAHARLVAPLKERVERLGRYLFGPSLSVAIDDQLAIESRTVEGRTVPFASLSGGTREQLAILVRLAAAMIVAPDGGVPLLLDDALGYSDPQRLAEMGAVFALAGRHCQVIVLTCHPERYRAVGGATVVDLS